MTATTIPNFSHEANKILLMNIIKILFYSIEWIYRGLIQKEGEHRGRHNDGNCGDRSRLNLGNAHQTVIARGHHCASFDAIF